MSTTRRRGTLPAAAVLLALALALAALAVRPRLAGAQTVTGDVILSASVVVDPDANGYVVLGGGTDIGLQAVVCSGSNPQGGTPQIPAQVMCQLRSRDAADHGAGHLPASPPGRLDTGKQRDPRATHPGRPVFRDEPMPGVTVGWPTGITMAPAGR